MTESAFSFPLWLILFIAAGFLLFILKISSGGKFQADEPRRIISLRLFLVIATALLVIAGLIHFYHWAQPG